MRIKIQFRQETPPVGSGKSAQPPEIQLTDLDTGKPLGGLIQSVTFHVSAEDMLPHLHIDLVPEEIEIEGEAYVRPTRMVLSDAAP
jgi:hypothetical protein